MDKEPAHRSVLLVPVPDAEPGLPLQGVPRVEGPAEDPVGRGVEGAEEGEERFDARDRLADGRCS